MRAVTVLAHRRAHYLVDTLAALRQCDGVASWQVLVVMDRPDQPTRDVVAHAVAHDWLWADIDLRPAGLPPYSRISRATAATLALGFTLADYVVHLEEDVVPAPGLLTWHAAMADRYAADQRVLTVNAWSGPPGVVHPQGDHLSPFFTPWGWGMWRDRWAWVSADWDNDYWDRHLNERLRGDRLGVFAGKSLVHNIGRIGTQPADEWDRRERAR